VTVILEFSATDTLAMNYGEIQTFNLTYHKNFFSMFLSVSSTHDKNTKKTFENWTLGTLTV